MNELDIENKPPFRPNTDHLRRSTLARAASERGDLAEAFEILRDLVEEGTQLWQPYHNLAAIALTQNDLETACNLLRAAADQPDAPTHVIRQFATLTASSGDTRTALATLSPLIRANAADADLLAQVREIVSAAPNISPVVWARLVSDLRAPTPEQMAQLASLEAKDKEILALTSDNRRLAEIIDTLRSELRLPRMERWNSRTSDVWTAIHELDDHAWLDALLNSVDVPSYRGFPMAGFPPEALQIGMVGSSNQSALREGFNFYRAVRDVCSKHGQSWNGEGKLLDFGTGWGRYARIFMKDFRPENVIGVDVDESYIRICRETFPYGRFEAVPALPPSTLDEDTFDQIIAYSVFSHLAEHAATAWIREFARILRPGGIVAVTTQGRSLLQVCERIREQATYEHPWHRHLARSFTNRVACEAAYDAGEYLYSATGGGDMRSADFYGEALIPRGFVERHWCDAFELVDFIDDRGFLPQALIVLRKRG